MKRLLVLVLVLGAAGTVAADEENDACLKCHGDTMSLRKAVTDPGREIAPLHVHGERFAGSVHKDVSCTDCHDGFDEHPHEAGAETLSCAECHEDQAAAAAKSVHGAARADGSGPRAGCADCHGIHYVLPLTERESRFHPLNVHTVCGKCHFSADPKHMTVEQILKERFTDDAHAHGVLVQGLTVAPTCVTCHGGHGIHAKGDPASVVARGNVDKLCGTCHVGALEAYHQSVHHLRANGPKHAGATCTDCHAPHDIDVSGHGFQTRAIAACSRCHKERSSTYRETYHGKVMAVESEVSGVATCSACHENHAIRRASDPASSIHPINLVETCGRCHEGSHARFVDYIVHADPRDGDAHPRLHAVYVAMTWLLIGTFVFGILHCLLWLIRGVAAKDWQHPKPVKTSRYFRRWPELYSRLHVGMMTGFLLLAGTGLPLHYSDTPWAHSVMRLLGGTQAAGNLHRAGGILLFVVIGIFLVDLMRRALVKKEKGLWSGPNTMLPRMQDLRDLLANVRWFLFLGPRPRFDRWTYWEKLDFWAVFWGIAIIGGSGLMLWFPEQATLFLPGWVLNVAVVVHGHEALLAVGFIFSVHFFHTHLRPEKFPMDTVFMTGRISEEEMKRERPLEYERMEAEGRLEEATSRRPRRRTRISAYVYGTIALSIGVALLIAMVAALLGD